MKLNSEKVAWQLFCVPDTILLRDYLLPSCPSINQIDAYNIHKKKSFTLFFHFFFFFPSGIVHIVTHVTKKKKASILIFFFYSFVTGYGRLTLLKLISIQWQDHYTLATESNSVASLCKESLKIHTSSKWCVFWVTAIYCFRQST